MEKRRREPHRDGRRQGHRYRSGWDTRGDATFNGTGAPALKDWLVIYEQAEDGGWGAHSPDVEGVFALGANRTEVEARMREALVAHLSYLRDDGQPVPEPHTDAGHVAA